MELIQNKFIEVSYNEDKKIMYAKWTKESKDLTGEEFKRINEQYVEFAEKYDIQSFLLNTEDFLFTISIDLQTWVATQILPQLKEKGVRKGAFIISEELISQLSIEQTMEENPKLVTVNYFSDEGVAEKWLLS